jgi:N-acetyltransferase 10
LLNLLAPLILPFFAIFTPQEHEDYEIIQSTNPEFNKAVVRVNIYHEHRQTIQYIHPSDSHKLGQAELVVIDEAAAIPLPLVRKLMGPHVVFMASTINGYEGTGRSLSLKLIDDLRKKSSIPGVGSGGDSTSSTPGGRVLREVTLNEPIRYASGDDVEKWLYDLLCLNAANVPKITSGCPLPEQCELYYVNRDTLFCYHKASDEFLHRVMSLYVASHYKNTPNDLQLLSDAPAHHIFVLLPPVTKEQTTLPDVLCVLQVCLEGEISKSSVMNSLARGQRSAGDLIPWTISQQFVDHDFAGLSGGRVVRIATHPDLQRMGYGSQALKLLLRYYEGHIPSLSENEMEVGIDKISELEKRGTDGPDLLTESIKPRTKLPPLLCKLSEREPENLDYLGVSFGLTVDLYKFWNRAGYTPVYIRQTPNDLTGEHSCIMLKTLDTSQAADGKWLKHYSSDFCHRFVSLLSYEFRSFSSGLGISILHPKKQNKLDQGSQAYGNEDLMRDFSKYDLKRIDLYSRNMADHHMIRDLVPKLSELYFLRKANFTLSAAQCAILLAMGLQRKTVKDVEVDLDLPASQIMGLYNRVIKKFNQMFEELQTKEMEEKIGDPKEVEMNPVQETLEDELTRAASEVTSKQKKTVEVLQGMDLSQFSITGNDEEWDKVLSSGKTPSMISISKKMKRGSSEPHDGGKTKSKKESKREGKRNH